MYELGSFSMLLICLCNSRTVRNQIWLQLTMIELRKCPTVYCEQL